MKHLTLSHLGRLKRLLLVCLFLLAALSFPACRFCHNKKSWDPPITASAAHRSCELTDIAKIFSPEDYSPIDKEPSVTLLESVEAAYTFACASRSPQQAVDAYYEALVRSWIFLSHYHSYVQLDNENHRAWDIYHSSLARLISAGQASGRLNLQKGLLVHTPSGMEWVPIQFNEFAWSNDSFNELIPVGCYHNKNILHQYRGCGLGIPLVAIRKNDCHFPPTNAYFFKQSPFAATAILFPNLQPWISFTEISQSPISNQTGLILYNPLKVARVQCGDTSYRLAADITAPLAALGQQTDWNPTEEFVRPETDLSLAGLRMLEPYQPGKIPLLFVHGLFSDPQTYLEMANQLRSRPDLNAQYQIWVFRYPTGGNFFLSAARLRKQLESLIAECNAQGHDDALQKTVIIGHSLGGLVAKLQVTDSGTILWNSVARVPLDQIIAAAEEHHQLAEQFFFTPSPHIKTAIFIATPNEGSPWAKRPVGKVASKMVKYSPDQTTIHRALIENNPDIFSPTMQRRSPTSIDLMNPDNELLQAIQKLPLAPWVQSYAIAGTGGSFCSRMGSSDGVVTIHSATTPPSSKTFYVDAVHTDILRYDKTINIVSQILRSHATQQGTVSSR